MEMGAMVSVVPQGARKDRWGSQEPKMAGQGPLEWEGQELQVHAGQEA